MIARLRRRHRTAFVLLAVLLPAGFAMALLGRSGPVHAVILPPDPRLASSVDVAGDTDLTALRPLTSAGGAVFRFARASETVTVVQTGEPAPDVLAYWTAASGELAALPAGATLLGAVGSRARRYRLPATGGQLLLFSLAHGAVLAQTGLEDR